MQGTIEREPMAKKKKKSESRKHTGMMRVNAQALERFKLAASLMRMSLADYVSEVLVKTADRDIAREAKKLTGEDER